MSLRPAAGFAAILSVLTVVVLAGCAPTVSLDAAPGSNDYGCAEITVRLPDSIGGKGIRETDAQATGAWGTPAAVLLRCGVAAIGPTTQPCITVNGIDWVLETSPDAKVIRYITFGRVPATEVIIDHGTNGVSDSAVLPALANAIGSVKQTSKCLDILDVPGSAPSATAAAPAPSPTPAPSARATQGASSSK
jgi:hypothetical protein